MNFGVGAITLLKILFEKQVHTEFVMSLAILCSIFAICFAYVFMYAPSSIGSEK